MPEGDTGSWIVREGGSTGLGFCLLACKGGVHKVSWVHSFLAKLRQKSRNKVWQWQPTPVLLPWNTEQRSLEGYSPWGHKESDRIEHTHTHTHTHTRCGKGERGRPLKLG